VIQTFYEFMVRGGGGDSPSAAASLLIVRTTACLNQKTGVLSFSENTMIPRKRHRFDEKKRLAYSLL